VKKLLGFFANKFVLTIIVFGIWMLYFDENDYFMMQRRKHELQNVKDNIAYLNKEIAGMEHSRSAMISEPKELEKYAREKYFMKRDNEDLYIVEKK
jgi:cell division protein DivIC